MTYLQYVKKFGFGDEIGTLGDRWEWGSRCNILRQLRRLSSYSQGVTSRPSGPQILRGREGYFLSPVLIKVLSMNSYGTWNAWTGE